MLNDPSIDLVEKSGYQEIGRQRRPHIPNIPDHQADPLSDIIKGCWLSSCGGLFRSSSVNSKYFDGMTNNQELTLLAFKLAVNKLKIHFLDELTYVVHNTEKSLSKSIEHSELAVPVLKLMNSYQLPVETKKLLEIKYRNIMHVLSEKHYCQGNMVKAWKYYILSLKPPYTFKYISFTRKLIGLR